MSLDDDATWVPGGDDRRGPSLEVGSEVNEYRIIRLLGRGGMGEVYEVEHRDLSTLHAMKLIHPDILERSGSDDRFRREAQVMARLNHPNIVHVDDFRQSDGRAWLRMERVDGGSLEDLLKKSATALEEPVIRHLLGQMLEALDYAHGEGVVHRDLKPANILLEESPNSAGLPQIKIADFGLVQLAGDAWLQDQVEQTVARSATIDTKKTILDTGSSPGTSSRALMGTFAYMSPEQKQGAQVDARSDLYAIGLMAYQMLTGLQNLSLKTPSRIRPELDPAWDAWVEKATESDPDERFSSAREMLDAMPGSAATAPKKRNLRPALLTLCLLLALAGGSAGYYFGIHLPAERERIFLETARGTLQIDSEPSGAYVLIDGEEAGKTPLSSGELRLGDYELTVRAEGYRSWKGNATILADENSDLGRIALERKTGSLQLELDPAETTWILEKSDDEIDPVEGSGALEAIELPTGDYLLKLSASGYLPQSQEFSIEDGTTQSIEISLEHEYGSLGIELENRIPNLSDLQILVGDVPIQWIPLGVDRLRTEDLPTGSWDLTLNLEGYEPVEASVEIEAETPYWLSVFMLPILAPGSDFNLSLGRGVDLPFVWIDALNAWVGQYEVSNAAFRRFRPDHDSGSVLLAGEVYSLNGAAQPAVRVSYDDALDFTHWVNQRPELLRRGASVRLLDGDEWSLIARCGEDRTFPWGNDWPPSRGNYRDQALVELTGELGISNYSDGHAVTAAISESGRNEWNLYGVGGNAWEWTSEGSDRTRMLRGGSWNTSSRDVLNIDYRYAANPANRNRNQGFRVLLQTE